jgi:PHS family inorganic phosphate transporter-like MFS transporter
MMAAVFLMQSLGQLAAALVGLVVLLALGSQKHLKDAHLDDSVRRRWVDTIWRSVIGAGVVPALVAIVFRLTIPESPRFTLDVDHDGQRALEDIREHYGGRDIGESSGYRRDHTAGDNDDANGPGPIQHSEPAPPNNPGSHDNGREGEEQQEEDEGESEEEEEEEENEDDDESDEDDNEEGNKHSKPFSKADLYDYFITQGSWRFLAGTSISKSYSALDFAISREPSKSRVLGTCLERPAATRHLSYVS